MTEKRARILFVSLAMVSLLSAWMIPNRLVGAAVTGGCVLIALAILYKNLAMLTHVEEDSPKLRTVRHITIMNVLIISMCVGFSILLESKMVKVSAEIEGYVAAFVVMVIMVVFGNLAPQVPNNRHTGLRLPWTVADEETWIIAHRILGYISMPLALFFLAGLVITGNVEAMVVLVVFLWIGIPGGISGVYFYKKYRGC